MIFVSERHLFLRSHKEGTVNLSIDCHRHVYPRVQSMMFYIHKTSLNAAARSYDQLTDYKSHSCARYQSAQQAIAASLTVIITGFAPGGGAKPYTNRHIPRPRHPQTNYLCEHGQLCMKNSFDELKFLKRTINY